MTQPRLDLTVRKLACIALYDFSVEMFAIRAVKACVQVLVDFHENLGCV
ncbi:MAG TPA: hypothetical protein VKV15_10850 [Bryobacteraceae bacterium]|nr:hypothetical protein [Bryobacteraceae bacterium]